MTKPAAIRSSVAAIAEKSPAAVQIVAPAVVDGGLRASKARPVRPGAASSQCAWVYHVGIEPDSRILYVGPDATPLTRWSDNVEWHHDGNSGTALTAPLQECAQPGSYSVIVLEDMPAAAEAFPEDWGIARPPFRGLHQLCSLLSPEGTLVLTFRTSLLGSMLPGGQSLRVGPVERALRAAGFASVTVLRMRDGLNVPDLHRLEVSSLLDLVKPGAVCVIARRVTRDSPIAAMLSRVGADTSSPTIEPTVHVGSGAVHRVHTDSSVVRMPQNAKALPRCANNFATLEYLRAIALPFDVPAAVCVRELHGLPVFVESRVGGDAPDYRRSSRRTRAAYQRRAVQALMALQSATRSQSTRAVEASHPLFRDPISRLLPHVDGETSRLLGRFLAALDEERHTELRTVVVHGDFKIANTLWTPDGELAAVVDWDLSHVEGLPVVDYATYLAFERHIDDGRPVCSAIADLLTPGHDETAYAEFCRDGLGLSDRAYSACVVMAIVHYATHNHGLQSGDAYRTWCDRHVSASLALACRRFLGEAADYAGHDSVGGPQ